MSPLHTSSRSREPIKLNFARGPRTRAAALTIVSCYSGSSRMVKLNAGEATTAMQRERKLS